MYGMTVTSFAGRKAPETVVLPGDPYENRTDAITQIDEVIREYPNHEAIRSGGGRVALRDRRGRVTVWSITSVDERNRPL